MADHPCTNEICIDREAQLRLARIRDELLTSFNGFLIERIRFLEQTIHQLSTCSSFNEPTQPTVRRKSHHLTPAVPQLRRSSSATTFFLQTPPSSKEIDQYGSGTARSCPSSVDLSEHPIYPTLHRTASTNSRQNLSIPFNRQWIYSSDDLRSKLPLITNDKGRLESRRFACDADDNDLRAFKAMAYMEQARKHHSTKPLHRLRQVLRMTQSNSSSFHPSKK